LGGHDEQIYVDISALGHVEGIWARYDKDLAGRPRALGASGGGARTGTREGPDHFAVKRGVGGVEREVVVDKLQTAKDTPCNAVVARATTALRTITQPVAVD